jgi:biopolymer transport protein ExbD
MAKISRREVAIEMTPMIDVVFQLIIFFIVTVKVNEQINREIVLPNGPHGEVIDGSNTRQQRALTIEVDRRGWTTIQNVPVTDEQLRGIVKRRREQFGDAFSLMIRGDYRSRHSHIQRVMNICTEEDIWRINFVAIQEDKSP